MVILVANKELVLIKERKKKERAKRLKKIRETGKVVSVTSLVPFFEDDVNSKKGGQVNGI